MFQFTPPRGGRLANSTRPRCIFRFISRPRVGGDWLAWNADEYKEFQFTPPRGGRQGFFAHLRLHWVFQFTPPRGGRPRKICIFHLSGTLLPCLNSTSVSYFIAGERAKVPKPFFKDTFHVIRSANPPVKTCELQVRAQGFAFIESMRQTEDQLSAWHRNVPLFPYRNCQDCSSANYLS